MMQGGQCTCGYHLEFVGVPSQNGVFDGDGREMGVILSEDAGDLING